MTALIQCKLTTGQSEVATVLAAHTHTDGCGFQYAWIDPYNPSLVWFYPACPVEAMIDRTKAAITILVTAAIALVALMDIADRDVHQLMMNTVENIRRSAADWLKDSTTGEIADFLQADNRLRGYIVDELLAQGVATQS